MQKIHFIRAEWDAEAKVWVATSDDVPGLATEAVTLEELSSKLDVMVPELLQLNEGSTEAEIPFELLARRFSVVQAALH
jgi:predicted RNase H-like HicB family nuclease